MTNSGATQLSLIAESDFTHRPVGDWEYDELGTEDFLVPNFPVQKLGTEDLLVPNFPDQKLGTEISKRPNFPVQKLGTEISKRPNFPDQKLGTEISKDYSQDQWKPPIGCLDRKWIKNHQYWCWRYYDARGKKRSIHLHKDYNRAVSKAMKIGIPLDAKCPDSTHTKTDSQSYHSTPSRLIDFASTAHGASRSTRAA